MNSTKIISPESNNISETTILQNKNNLISNYPDLMMNTEFDENIYFTHFFNTFQHLEYENNKTIEFPFLLVKEFNYGYFEEIKIIKEPNILSINTITGHIKKFQNTSDSIFKKNFIDNILIYSESISGNPIRSKYRMKLDIIACEKGSSNFAIRLKFSFNSLRENELLF